jgi:hypothetical protein
LGETTPSERVRLYSRPGNDLIDRFPLIVKALAGVHLVVVLEPQPGA